MFGKGYVDKYDNAVLYIDYLLSEINKKFFRKNDSVLFVYFSDHADAVDGKQGHALLKPLQDEYRIPIIIWSSMKNDKRLQKLKALNNSRINGECIYDIIAYLVGVTDTLDISFSPHVISVRRGHRINYCIIPAVLTKEVCPDTLHLF